MSMSLILSPDDCSDKPDVEVPQLRAVVLNDTSREKHHGCDRVMSTLFRALDDCGVDVSLTWHLNADLNDPELKSSLNACDLALINGEGTIHHGNPYTENLLQKSGQRPVAMCLYKEHRQTGLAATERWQIAGCCCQ